jgi:hypothetical protein
MQDYIVWVNADPPQCQQISRIHVNIMGKCKQPFGDLSTLGLWPSITVSSPSESTIDTNPLQIEYLERTLFKPLFGDTCVSSPQGIDSKMFRGKRSLYHMSPPSHLLPGLERSSRVFSSGLHGVLICSYTHTTSLKWSPQPKDLIL